ncbi:alpha/beta hydrolase [Butyrivibrio sp. WCE2006]|uniref:alpha/beta hydrolase n=1 Tax=Butyrivibrio sp. WCE2006 TaxID=1410611 RepID=UPI000678C1EF|nr:alpha/beta hydrolase-fold protein [Butyrivibrio sp. WCE2006]
MKMQLKRYIAGGRECASNEVSEPECVVIQLHGELEMNSINKEIENIEVDSERKVLYVFCKIEDWDKELAPWSAPPVFGNVPFGAGAKDTLEFIENELLPAINAEYKIASECPKILVGYSLAGLFSLWSAYQNDLFDAVAAVSPSVWFPDWIEYAKANQPKTKNIYLSLGDKEDKTRNKVMKNVGNCILMQKEIFDQQNDMSSTFEWNEGNHFNNEELRCAKGINWCLKNVL